MNRDDLADKYGDIELLLADGFDEAILGIEYNSNRVVYSYDKMIDLLTEDNEMSTEDAVEFLEYNVLNAYVGEQTPIFVI